MIRFLVLALCFIGMAAPSWAVEDGMVFEQRADGSYWAGPFIGDWTRPLSNASPVGSSKFNCQIEPTSVRMEFTPGGCAAYPGTKNEKWIVIEQDEVLRNSIVRGTNFVKANTDEATLVEINGHSIGGVLYPIDGHSLHGIGTNLNFRGQTDFPLFVFKRDRLPINMKVLFANVNPLFGPDWSGKVTLGDVVLEDTHTLLRLMD